MNWLPHPHLYRIPQHHQSHPHMSRDRLNRAMLAPDESLDDDDAKSIIGCSRYVSRQSRIDISRGTAGIWDVVKVFAEELQHSGPMAIADKLKNNTLPDAFKRVLNQRLHLLVADSKIDSKEDLTPMIVTLGAVLATCTKHLWSSAISLTR